MVTKKVTPTVGTLVWPHAGRLTGIEMVTAGSAISELSIYDGSYIDKLDKIGNGTFAADLSSWTAGANWAWSSGAALHTVGEIATLSQSVGAVATNFYRVVFTIGKTGALGGSLSSVSLGGTALAGTFDTKATYEIYVQATNTDALIFTPTIDFDGWIDDVSVKQICSPTQIVYMGKFVTLNDSKFVSFLEMPRFFQDGIFCVLTGANSAVYLDL